MDPQDPTQQTQGATAGSQNSSPLPPAIAAKYPDLEQLIRKTESMTDEERNYWFQILPIMTDQQVEKLRGILLHEKEQLSKLDSEYQEELSKINAKHMNEWKGEESRAEREKREAEEKAHEAEEKAQEAALLGQLDPSSDEDYAHDAPLAG